MRINRSFIPTGPTRDDQIADRHITPLLALGALEVKANPGTHQKYVSGYAIRVPILFATPLEVRQARRSNCFDVAVIGTAAAAEYV
jgi:hypothetical protein